jgi:hypothetical protein
MFCFYCDIIIYYYIIIVSTSKIAYQLIDQAAEIIVLDRSFYEFYIFPNYLYNMKNLNWSAEDL